MDLEDEGQGLLGGLVFGGAGLLMLYNIVSGEAEIVHRGGTSRALGTILGDNAFLALTCLVCLLLGGFGLYSFASSFFSDPPEEDSSEASAGESSRPRAIRFTCPHCQGVSRIPAEYLGRQGRCPKCKARVEVVEDA